MKKLVFFLYILVSFVLVACTVEEPTSPLDTIKDQVQIIYASGDNAQNVTQNFTIPTQVGDATITWTSNKPDVIQINGSTVTITRGNTDVSVKVTATITLNEDSTDKDFTVIVKALVQNTVTYTITWVIDGITTTTLVEAGQTPSKPNPSKEGYFFVGWSPVIVVATADATYTAVFELIPVNDKAEIDKSDLNQYFDFDIYSLLPKMYSDDYEVSDWSSDDYPVDIYVDFFDWDEEDATNYDQLLDSKLEYDELELAYIVGDFYIYVDIFDGVYYINIYTYPEGGQTPDGEIDPTELNQMVGFNIYSMLPKIYSSDYALENFGDGDFPIDIYIDLFDWTVTQYQNYLNALDAAYEYVETVYFDAYKVGDFYVLPYLEDEYYDVPVYSINIFTVLDDETPDPVEGDEITITSKGSSNVNMPDGSVNAYVNIITGGPTIDVIHTKHDGTVASIFNNSQSEIRLYHSNGKGNGNELTFVIQDGYLITGIAITVGNNNGLSINGGPINTQTSTTITQSFGSGLSSISIQNKGTATSSHIAIKSIIIYYVDGEAVSIESWSEAIDDLETKLGINALDALFPEIPNLSNFNIVSANGGYTLSATATSNAQTILTNYKTTLLELDYVEDGQVLRYELSESLGIEVSLSSNGNDLSIYVKKYTPNIVDGELENLGLMKSITDFELETFGKSGLPSTGSYHVLVVPVEINDDPFPDGYATVLNKVFNGTELETGWESVGSFYRQSSFGKLDITFDIAPKYISQNNKSFYSNDDGDQVLIKEALYGLDSQIDYSQYDFNNDGVLDSVIFIYSSDYNYDVNPWWAWVSVMDSSLSPLDGKEVEYYMWASYHFILDSIPGYSVSYNAETFIHELGHLLGIDDLYSGTHNYGPLGGWDMMDWNAGDHGPFNKLVFGWLNPLVAVNGTYNVTLDSYSLDDDGEQSVLLIPYNVNDFADGDAFDEYLLVMFYTPGGLYDAHYNTNISVENTGIVIYHVDARMNSNVGFWDYYMQNNNDGTNNFLVQILEADKNNSIPHNNTEISQSDLLTNGSIDLSTYKWNQGNASINVTISLTETLTNNMTSTTITVSVNA